MSLALALAAALYGPPAPAAPEAAPADTVAPAEPAAPSTDAPPAPGDAVADPSSDPAGSPGATSADPAAQAEPAATETIEPQPEADEEPAAEAEAEPPADESVLHVATERPGPPYYDEKDLATLRARHDAPVESPPPREPVRWRCLIADPTCRHTFEVVAMGAYAMRFQQGDVREQNARRWSTGRAQYDFWADLPVLVETIGKSKYTKMSLGPKGGVIFSDTGDLWGNVGIAGRYWLGTGRWAPAIEFTSALSFKIGGRPTRDLGGEDPKWEMQRGPVGFTADVGFGLGGFGAIVFGGQYDSPLAREDVPERFRTAAAGMFFIGFRGNILWGGPAAAAILTHGLTQRLATQPR